MEYGNAKQKEKCVVLGDFNCHRSKHKDGYKSVLGRFRYGLRNANSERVLEFPDSFGQRITNTGFEKDKQIDN